MNELEKYTSDNVSKVLVGNKCDLESERVVSEDEAKEVASFYRMPYFETSAKDGTNVNEAFNELVSMMEVRLKDYQGITIRPQTT